MVKNILMYWILNLEMLCKIRLNNKLYMWLVEELFC